MVENMGMTALIVRGESLNNKRFSASKHVCATRAGLSAQNSSSSTLSCCQPTLRLCIDLKRTPANSQCNHIQRPTPQ